MKMGGQFAPETGWSVWSGKHLKCDLFRGGQFAPESGGQFDRILHLLMFYDFIRKTQISRAWRIEIC